MASPAQTGAVGQPPPTSAPASANPPVPSPPDEADQHAREVEDREAYEYWGYLFKPDKTGTDKLKGLLRGLKDHMSANYEPSDSHDLTPTQLAHFYRDLNGNYDQLFLGTPSESIAFIYKSLGCLHSLQPLPHSTAFTDPTVPALKTEGWIMWQTIQLLLGPEEHSSFLIEALQRWDLKDPATGETLPKILPRRCFPMEPDRHMVAWYEGVSERLRKEAEDEERQRQVEAEQAEVRRLHHKRWDEHTDDESSVDSRGPALAYFRNPLYRHVDGRPTIVRRSSKRPALSPRPTSMMDKGKDAATSVGHVIRNIGSPHLWDGRKPSKSHSQDRDHRRRRSSFPDNRYSGPADVPPPPNEAYDTRPMPDRRPSSTHHHHRRRTPPDGPSDEYDADDSAAYSPRPSPRISRHSHHSQDYDNPALLRHSRSHEPTPSQKEYGDYFEGYDDPGRTSGVGSNTSNNTMGPSFGPSASPLFASHVAKQPQPPAAAAPRPTRSPYSPSRMPPNVRRAQQDRPYSRSPDPSSSGRASRPRNEDRYPPPRGDDNYNNNNSNSRPSSRRYDSPRRSRYGGSPGSGGGSGNRYDDLAGGFAPPGPPPPGPPHGASAAAGPPPVGAYHHSQPGFPPVGAPITAPPGPYPLGGARDRRSAQQQQQQRASAGSDVSGYDDRDYRDRERDRDREHRDNRERRGSGAPAKQTRFAAGVDGRRYPNESPWR